MKSRLSSKDDCLSKRVVCPFAKPFRNTSLLEKHKCQPYDTVVSVGIKRADKCIKEWPNGVFIEFKKGVAK